MTDETDFTSIADLYRQVSDSESVSYTSFLKKIKRLELQNRRTYNRLIRSLGVEPDKNHKVAPKRVFVAYDGEGWSDKYVLLANSLGERISDQGGLPTKACLEFLSQPYDQPIKRIFFSFNYDVNHIIKDFSDEQIEILLTGRSVNYDEYRVSYIPGKIFIVNGFRYYDIFSFFATSFINVVRKMLGPEFVTKSLIEGKSDRNKFETWDLDRIIAYNDEELSLMVQVADKLREAFEEIGVALTEWYGPGAVAKYWFREHNVLPNEKHTENTLTALNSAYYGGRFEQLTLGKVKNIYEYDIHSAYPSAMADMPYFTSWTTVPKGQFRDNPYSVWYISFDLRESQHHSERMYDNSPYAPTFGPLPVRSKDGRICYPLVGKGWYWHSEVQVMLDFFPTAKVIYHKGYVAETEGQPFAWIKELYDYRQKLKDSGNLAQYAIKVGLNSLYGKCAQRVGRNPYFSLAWAGYITATTRAKLARAGYENGSQHVLGFATDALFTDTKFNLRISDDLGSWEESRFRSAIFFQVGVYRVVKEDGTIDDRYRGSPLRKGIDDIIDQLKRYPTKYPKVRMARFVSHMLAIKAPKAYRQYRAKFIQVQHTLNLDAPYKRHYHGFWTGLTPNGESRNDYSKLLRGPITSTPKVYSGDNNPWLSDKYLWNEIRPTYIESQPPPMKDANTQRLLEDAEILAIEEGYDTLSNLETLPVVEDEME